MKLIRRIISAYFIVSNKVTRFDGWKFDFCTPRAKQDFLLHINDKIVGNRSKVSARLWELFLRGANEHMRRAKFSHNETALSAYARGE